MSITDLVHRIPHPDVRTASEPYSERFLPALIKLLEDATDTTWAEGVAARYRFWIDDPRLGPLHCGPLPSATHQLVTDEVTQTMIASWVLFYSGEHYQQNYTADVRKRSDRPLWDQYRKDPDTDTYYRAQVHGAWEKKTDIGAAARMHRDILDILRTLIALNAQHEPNKDDTERYRSWRKIDKALRTTQGSPTASKRLVAEIMESPMMYTSTEQINTVYGMVAFPNAMMVTDIPHHGSLHEPGQIIEPHPEAMITSPMAVRWDESLPDLTPDFLSDPEFIHTYQSLWNRIPYFKSYLDRAFPTDADRDTFLRVMGSTIFGRSHKTIFAFIGKSGAGKDQMLGLMKDLMGGRSMADLPVEAFKYRSLSAGDIRQTFAKLENTRFARIQEEL